MEATPAVDLARPAPPPGGRAADLIASRIPPGRVMTTLDQCQGVQGVVWRCQKTLQNLGPEAPKSRSGGVLGRLVGVLGFLGASWGSRRVSLERLGRILGHLGGVLRTFWGVLGVSCMCLGGLLDPSCGHLGSVLGASWGVLEASWGRLGASCVRLGCVLGRLGCVLGRLLRVLGRLGGILCLIFLAKGGCI